MIPGFRNPLSKEWPTPRPDDSRIWKQSSAEPNRRHARRNEIPVQADPTVLGELYALSSGQKDSTRRAWKIFKENPFERRLRAHKYTGSPPGTAAPFTRWKLNRICALCFTSNTMWL